MAVLTNRHDVLILFDVTCGNPNGDPDAGNMPRIDPTTNRGLVTDVCLKRKVRNYVLHLAPEVDADSGNQYDILIQQGAVLNTLIEEGIKAATKPLPKNASEKERKDQQEAAMRWLCRRYYDVRTFGAVLSTGKDILKGSSFGQVRGPAQVTFSRSLHPIVPLEVSITRCAVTKEEDAKKERTMGNKHIVPYGLYAAKVYISPVFAKVTGFTDKDLRVFFLSLSEMFAHDQSSARGEMVVRAIYDFEHVGTQPAANAEQNGQEARLGCAHAHRLFAGIHVELEDREKQYPTCFEDYVVRDEWAEHPTENGVTKGVKPGVNLNRRVSPT